MVELISQHDDEPSVVREAFARHETGVHHVAHIVDNLEMTLDHCRAEGGSLVMDASTADGVRFVMVQMPMLGHYLELYEATPGLTRFYDYIRRKAQGWDGTDPLRRLS
jgi:catechol 2,3-dioxygenase-like lactoylglutathione lyase family enzyme